ncbi:HEAT repeat domain-containing protein [Archangium violaceum]|uniref:HEAT repeat domain-containing protein n=1 Tax=Archangium violaceum TaxID=83451 RepID=UPI0036DA73EC
MPRELDLDQWKDDLVTACRFGEEERARALVQEPGPRKARVLLEAMMEDEEGLVRQAAAFGLGELGGAASARRLEQQLVREEARGDYDGESVAEAITQALGRLKGTGARSSLIRKLQRSSVGTMDPADLCTLARSLWRRRHPELLPPIRKALEQLPPAPPTALHGLLVLLEMPPEQLRTWAQDTSIPIELKEEVLSVLTEDITEALVSTLPSFISTAHAFPETTMREEGAVSSYYLALLSLLLRHREYLRPLLSPETQSELRALARKLVAATALSNCAIRAAVLLQYVGSPEDADLLLAHRPAEPILAKVFDDAAQALRLRPVQ